MTLSLLISALMAGSAASLIAVLVADAAKTMRVKAPARARTGAPKHARLAPPR